MDYGLALTFIFKDPDWQKKILIGALLILGSFITSILLIGLAGFAIWSGYALRLLQNVRDDMEHPLPEWDDLSGDFIRGVKYAIINLVWSLPVIILTFAFFGATIFASLAGQSMLSVNDLVVFQLLSFPVIYGFMGVIMAYSLVLALATPGYTLGFAQEERISAGFSLRTIWRWTRANLGQVIVVALIILGAGTVIQQIAFFAGVLLVGCGLLITLPLGAVFYSTFKNHLYGQLAANHPYPDALQALGLDLSSDESAVVPSPVLSAAVDNESNEESDAEDGDPSS